MSLIVEGEAAFYNGAVRTMLIVHVRDSNGDAVTDLTEANFKVSQHDLGIDWFDPEDFWVLELSDYFPDEYTGIYHISLPPHQVLRDGQTVYLVRVSMTTIESFSASASDQIRRAVAVRPALIDGAATRQGEARPKPEPRALTATTEDGFALIPMVFFGSH